jgi:hypothetical protein
MSKRPEKESGLSTKARLTLFHSTALTAEQALTYEDHAIDFALLCDQGVKALNLLTAGVGPMELKARGAPDALALRTHFGFSALHLCDAAFANEICLAYGAEDVRRAFLTAPQDAVAVSGSEAMRILDVSTAQLLELCAGFPTEALHVLKQLPAGAGLREVDANVVLDSGLRVGSLKQCGYTLQALVDQTGATGAQLSKLGYTF